MQKCARRALSVLALCLLSSSSIVAQIPGQNINMVSGTQWPDGDPFLQRQNEPSAAVSSRNLQHLLAAANDYRTVDIPFPNAGDEENADAWMGVFRSTDGGLTWKSTLVPGYPQDNSPEGLASPLKAYGVATDPTLRAGTHGLLYLSGLVFTRNDGPTGVFAASYQDQNNKGNGNPFTYLGATVIDTGTSGQFLDKPWIAVDVPRTGTVGSATCTINGKTFASGNAYLVYSKFLGTNPTNNPHTQILMTRSTNCGQTWSSPQKLSESFQLNQGTIAAIDPRNGALYVAWRQIATGSQPDAIIYALSTDGGRTFTKGQTVYTFAPGTAFDLNSSGAQFRTISLPAMTVDASGRVWIGFSLRNMGANGAARIMMTTLAPGSSTWTAPFAADTTAGATTYGHQFLPAMSFAFGRLMLTFYDQRDDNTKGILNCSSGLCTETRQPVGDLAANNSAAVFNAGLSDAGVKVRHTLDVRGALVDPSQFNGTLAFPSVRISQYVYGSRPGNGPRPVEQLQYNPPNFPMFVQGTRPFIGDYIDVAAQTIAADGQGNWVYNTQHSSAAVFHPVWTDNRDVRTPPVVCANNVCTQDWKQYTPVGSIGGKSLYDANQNRPACVAGATGTRNQNIYTARITEGLYVAFRENAKNKTSGGVIAREFALLVANNTNSTAYYRLTINQPAGNYSASFLKDQVVTSLDVAVLARSTVSRSVFVIPQALASLPYPSVSVSVAQIGAVGGNKISGGLQSVAITNPDITNPDITNPDITNPDITNPDITNPDITNPDIATAEVYNPTITNPDITNPDITNPDITNPDITNPDISNPQITNPDITNPDISTLVVTNPDITNPDITNPDITNPDITNPDITNPDIAALPSGTTDLTWKVTNKGNTTSAYNAKMLSASSLCCPPGGACSPGQQKCQLILRKTYPTPVANQCSLTVQTQNIPISSIPNPSFAAVENVGNPDVRPDGDNASLTLGPGEAGRLTLRVFGSVTTDQIAGLKPAAVAFGANTNQAFTGVSLTIQTSSLPPVFVGVPYTAQLKAVGGVGALTWNVASGSLPAGLILDATTGKISGTLTGVAGSSQVQFRVIDSPLPGGIQQADWKFLEFDVQQFTVQSVSVYKLATGLSFARNGDDIEVEVTVSNLGTLTASNVTPTVTAVPAGAVTCNTPVPPSANILGGSLQLFRVYCTVGTATGTVTFSASASGSFPGGVFMSTAASSTATASLVVDNNPPTISTSASTQAGQYTAGTWTNKPVTVTFTCSDAESGVAAGFPTGNTTISVATAGATVSGSCQDNAGNTSNLNFGPIQIDLAAPVVTFGAPTPAPNANGWNNTNVTIPYTVTDTGSGVASGGGSMVLSAEGSAVTGSVTVTDLAGNSATYTTPPVKIDKTPPVVVITSPVNGSTVTFGASLTMQFTCSDSLSGIATCSGNPANGAALNTTTVGTQTVSAMATDKAGNTVTVTSSYSVNYKFTGFQTPLATAGPTAAPSFSGTFNAGKAIPIKWSLFSSDGTLITDLGTLKLMTASFNSVCAGPPNGSTFLLYSPTAGATGGSTFRFSSTGYIFNWDTSSVGKGCWNLVVTLSDNTSYATIVQLQ